VRFDLIIVGSGPGGYVAAIRASRLGLKTAIVEREHLGGICLNWGCIPTKALLRSAEVYDLFCHASQFGLAADHVRFDAKAVVQRSRDVSRSLSRGVASLLKRIDSRIRHRDGTGDDGSGAHSVCVSTSHSVRGDARERFGGLWAHYSCIAERDVSRIATFASFQ
jgi:dihydrolipoamide dehydrogenase